MYVSNAEWHIFECNPWGVVSMPWVGVWERSRGSWRSEGSECS